ncbi:hypothetical protein KVT40_001344 [Elsinoe batatas]|uniref:Uncharacterized protein n=1 Tax=Elsinoe batatas TaxID=2601811 RepID=A0A8K0L914_9PEZI|nr:hypothetical protein KVT40_001344 [Elsinoe batatas]
MPFDDRDAVSLGRKSRTSTMSTTSRLKPPNQSDDLLGASAPGVMSMLRTSTDTGDLGMLSVNQGRMPPINRQAQRNRAHPARLSDGSMRSNHTGKVLKRSSQNTPWDGGSASHRGSISSLQTSRTGPYDSHGPPAYPPPIRGLPPNPSPAPSSLDGRSYSLTHGRLPQHTLLGQRSVSSLRSQGATPRMYPRGPPVYPSRPPRPGYRSVSPALSDYHVPRQPPSGRYQQRPPMPSYHSEYAYGPPLPGPQPRYPPMQHPPSRYMQPPSMPMHAYDQPQYSYQALPPGPANHRHAVMYGPPPMRQGLHPHYGYPPRRAYTPGLDATPPSSGPNSSAPHSSNPSTPQDLTAGNIAIDPNFIEPALEEIQDENSEQAAYSSYIAYASKANDMVEPEVEPILEVAHEMEADLDHHELEARELEGEVGPGQIKVAAVEDRLPTSAPSTPAAHAGGLVQRMKALLENKHDASPPAPLKVPIRKISEHQLRRERTVSELPATPVKVTEVIVDVKADESPKVTASRGEVRITRELVRATLSPSSSEHETLLQDLARLKRASQHESVNEEVLGVRRPSSEYPSEMVAPTTAPADEATIHGSDDTLSEKDEIVRSDPNDFAVKIEIPAIAPPVAPKAEVEEVVQVKVLPSTTEVTKPEVTDVAAAQSNPHRFSIPGQFPDEACDSPKSDATSSPAQTSDEPATVAPHIEVVSRFDTDEDIDTNAGVTSDIITDIAVRFSIPRQASMVKANIIRVSSIPEHQPKLHKDIHELPEAISPRESVYQDMDTIAPLQVTKQDKPSAKTESSKQDEGTDLSSFIRRSFPRRHSAFLRDKNKNASGQNKENEKPGAGQSSRLPDLEEASQEDMASAKRLSSDHAGSEGTVRLRSEMTLSEVRNLPSLNFSQMNLIDQLNAALEYHDSRSLEIVRKHLSSGAIVSPSPLRPSSTEALRERYTSFFAKPEDFHVPTPGEESESMSMSILAPLPKEKIQSSTASDKKHQERISSEQPHPLDGRESRPLSPTELLGVASEANRISVPSVDALSYRLSELLPSLKRLHLDSTIADEQKIKQTIDEIHHLGERPNTMLSARSSSVLRSLAAIADDIATNASDSTVGTAIIHPPLRRTQSDSRDSNIMSSSQAGISTTRRSFTTSNPNSRPWNFDENYPWSTDVGPMEIDLKVDFDSTPDRESIASHILRAKAQGTDRGSVSALDISLSRVGENDAEDSSPAEVSELEPTATVTADTLTGNRHQRVLSKKATSLFGSLSRRAKMTSPLRPSMDSLSNKRPGTGMSGALSPDPDRGFHRDVDAIIETETIKSVGTNKTSKSKGKARSYTPQLMGKKSADKLNASIPLPVDSAQDKQPDKPHAVSDRYPYTALSPPAGYDLDEVRSYFSDDNDSTRTGARSRSLRNRSRAGSRGEVLRKRLSGLSSLRFRPGIMVTRPDRPDSQGSWISGGSPDNIAAAEAMRVDELSRVSADGKPLGRSRTITGVLGGRSLGSRMSNRGPSRMAHSMGSRGAGSRLSYLSRSSGVGGGGYEVAQGAGTESGIPSPDWFAGNGGMGGVQIMSKGRMELGIRRFGEKVKGVLYKGGRLLRRVSGRERRARRKRREEAAWMDDGGGSLYSGT